LDFALALSSASAPTTVAARAVAPAPSGGKKKAENPFGISNEAYKVAVDIARSRLQVAPAPSAAVDSVSPGVRSSPANPASRSGQPLVPLSSTSADAAGLGGGRKRRRADSGGLSQAPAAKKSKAWRDGLSGMKLKREQATTTDRNAVSLALKLIKASEKWLKATADERKEIEKEKKEEVMKDRLVFVFITPC
jgi:hypothetical protein